MGVVWGQWGQLGWGQGGIVPRRGWAAVLLVIPRPHGRRGWAPVPAPVLVVFLVVSVVAADGVLSGAALAVHLGVVDLEVDHLEWREGRG